MSFKCGNCGVDVPQGTLSDDADKLELTRACKVCIDTTRNPRKRNRVAMMTKTSALLILSTKTLSTLKCVEKNNPVYRSGPKMRLFSEFEVDLAKNEEKAGKETIDIEAMKARDARVALLPFSTGDIPLDYREAVLGDFDHIVVNKHYKPKTSRTKVIQAQKEMAMTIHVSEQVKAKMMSLDFGAFHIDASGSILNFCLHFTSLWKKNNNRSKKPPICEDFVNSFVRTQKLRRDVMAIPFLVTQIAVFLIPIERLGAETVIPGFKRGVEEATVKRKAMLIAEVLRRGGSDSACLSEISSNRVKRYMQHLNQTLEIVADRLCDFQFTRNDKVLREKRLKAALDHYELTLRPHHLLCARYIGGLTDIDPEEVAGIMQIEEELKGIGGQAAYIEYHAQTEALFDKALWKKGMGWHDAGRESLKILPRVRSRNFNRRSFTGFHDTSYYDIITGDYDMSDY